MAIQQRELLVSDDFTDARIRIFPGGTVVSITLDTPDAPDRIVLTTEMFKRIAAEIDDATTEVL